MTRAISSGVTIGDDAKPQAPFTITRTPKPKLESSVTFGTASVFAVPRSGDSRRPDPLIADAHDADIGVGGFQLLGLAPAPQRPAFPVPAIGVFEPAAAPNNRSAAAAAETATNPRRVIIYGCPFYPLCGAGLSCIAALISTAGGPPRHPFAENAPARRVPI